MGGVAAVDERHGWAENKWHERLRLGQGQPCSWDQNQAPTPKPRLPHATSLAQLHLNAALNPDE